MHVNCKDLSTVTRTRLVVVYIHKKKTVAITASYTIIHYIYFLEVIYKDRNIFEH